MKCDQLRVHKIDDFNMTKLPCDRLAQPYIQSFHNGDPPKYVVRCKAHILNNWASYFKEISEKEYNAYLKTRILK